LELVEAGWDTVEEKLHMGIEATEGDHVLAAAESMDTG
jgi:hypothetical protein